MVEPTETSRPFGLWKKQLLEYNRTPKQIARDIQRHAFYRNLFDRHLLPLGVPEEFHKEIHRRVSRALTDHLTRFRAGHYKSRFSGSVRAHLKNGIPISATAVLLGLVPLEKMRTGKMKDSVGLERKLRRKKITPKTAARFIIASDAYAARLVRALSRRMLSREALARIRNLAESEMVNALSTYLKKSQTTPLGVYLTKTLDRILKPAVASEISGVPATRIQLVAPYQNLDELLKSSDSEAAVTELFASKKFVEKVQRAFANHGIQADQQDHEDIQTKLRKDLVKVARKVQSGEWTTPARILLHKHYRRIPEIVAALVERKRAQA